MAYSNAPIQEAVFDIRIDKLKTSQLKDLLKFKEYLHQEYIIEKKKHAFSSTFELEPGKSEVTSLTKNELTGYIFSTADNKRQFQVRIDGFTHNVLNPYNSWEVHFEEFIKYWQVYKELFEPNFISRIAVRYINRIEIPLPLTSFQEYVNYVPPVPKALPNVLGGFFMQVQAPCHDKIRSVTITETIDQQVDNKLFFILDVDVFQTIDIGKSKEDLIENFNKIRIIKNEVFESCITEKSRNLFL